MVVTSLARSKTTEELVALLSPHTPFAEAIVKRQAERAGLDLAGLREEHLATLGPMIVKAAATFVDPAALALIKRRLLP